MNPKIHNKVYRFLFSSLSSLRNERRKQAQNSNEEETKKKSPAACLRLTLATENE
jgi:hypothetical protein